MYNMSAAMAGEFARAAQEMTERVETLGPNRLKNGVSGTEEQQTG
jgi:coenzyme F420-reducing hydrogenase delta subunit